MHTLNIKTPDFYKRAASVAEHYGFMPVHEVAQMHNRPKSRELVLSSSRVSHSDVPQHIFKDGVSRTTSTAALASKEPILFYTPLIATERTPGKRTSTLALNVVATRQPLAEVLILKAAVAILEEFGIKDARIRINSIGDRDSSARFVREASVVIRKRLSDLSPEHRDLAKNDIPGLLVQFHNEGHAILEELPRAVECLTAPSRKHFRDVLEYLDGTGLAYELDDRFIAHRSTYSHTIFELLPKATDDVKAVVTPYARGGRYDELTKTISRTAIPAVGIVLSFRTTPHAALTVRVQTQKPKACLIHIGNEARVRGFAVLEMFRRARVPVEQCLQFERFSEQLAYAESRNAPFVIIMGQKEAHDGNVIVRNASTRMQTTVPIELLPNFFKTLGV